MEGMEAQPNQGRIPIPHEMDGGRHGGTTSRAGSPSHGGWMEAQQAGQDPHPMWDCRRKGLMEEGMEEQPNQGRIPIPWGMDGGRDWRHSNQGRIPIPCGMDEWMEAQQAG